jgi:hypothetical protein
VRKSRPRQSPLACVDAGEHRVDRTELVCVATGADDLNEPVDKARMSAPAQRERAERVGESLPARPARLNPWKEGGTVGLNGSSVLPLHHHSSAWPHPTLSRTRPADRTRSVPRAVAFRSMAGDPSGRGRNVFGHAADPHDAPR